MLSSINVLIFFLNITEPILPHPSGMETRDPYVRDLSSRQIQLN